MVTKGERKLIAMLIRLKVFSLFIGMRNVNVDSRWGFKWLLKRIKERQIVDDLHHAPCCPANHFHKQRLVFQYCNCGAAKHEKETP